MAARPKHAPAKKSSAPAPASDRGQVKIWIAAGLVVAAAFGVYQFTAARPNAVGSATQSSSGSGASRITGPETDGAAQVSGGVQKISVAVSNVYNPNVIQLKAGIPAEITFAGGQGCTTVVHSQQLGFQEDLTSGPKTVKLQALQPGTYAFSCGMDMVFGRVVVQ